MRYSYAVIIVLAFAGPAWCQQLAPDAAGCVDTKVIPRIGGCRIDNCERPNSGRREIPVREDKNGEPFRLPVDGDIRRTMYECVDSVTPAAVSEFTSKALREAGFRVPYVSTLADALLSAQKENVWVVVEAVAKYYTVTEIKVSLDDPDEITDAASMADEIEKLGHVVIYRIHFGPKTAITRDSEPILREVMTLLKEHPEYNLRLESHTAKGVSDAADAAQAHEEAEAVVTWLQSHGFGTERLTLQSRGSTEPIADNATPEGRARNHRIELVRR